MSGIDLSKIKWRVWWNPQVGSGCGTFFYECPSLEAALMLDDALGKYDLFQLENNIKPDFSNAGGVQWFCDGVTNSDPDSSDDGWWDYDEEDFKAIIAELRQSATPRAAGTGRVQFRLLDSQIHTSCTAAELQAAEHYWGKMRDDHALAAATATRITQSLRVSVKTVESGFPYGDFSDIAILWLAWEIIEGRGSQYLIT